MDKAIKEGFKSRMHVVALFMENFIRLLVICGLLGKEFPEYDFCKEVHFVFEVLDLN